MGEFITNVKSFYSAIEACGKEQRHIAAEVMESFSAFIEETLLTFHIKVGASDTTNMQDLLFQDLLDLVRHIKPEMNERVKSYLKRIQETKEDRLYRLRRRISMLRPNSKVTKEQVLGWKMKEQEMKDLVDFLSITASLIQGISLCNPKESFFKNLLEKAIRHRETFGYQSGVLEVEEINKRHLGKMIIQHVGHEGVEDKPVLRRLLQACIDFLQTETGNVWKNASITIYDDEDKMYKIASGTKKHQFICQMKNGEPFIKDRKGSSEKTRIQSTPRSTTDITDDTSRERGDGQNCTIA
ncbi:uncharacterized protein [Magallana gigas]|uniref:uncharacterized protein n=1 Tax=Magallana gigas TaxID=29159 RepID=UPI003342730F